MKKVIFAALIVSATFACKKNADVKTEAPVKYYFKIVPISEDGSKNDTTTYKLITVD
jgi:hypothetical protein